MEEEADWGGNEPEQDAANAGQDDAEKKPADDEDSKEKEDKDEERWKDGDGKTEDDTAKSGTWKGRGWSSWSSNNWKKGDWSKGWSKDWSKDWAKEKEEETDPNRPKILSRAERERAEQKRLKEAANGDKFTPTPKSTRVKNSLFTYEPVVKIPPPSAKKAEEASKPSTPAKAVEGKSAAKPGTSEATSVPPKTADVKVEPQQGEGATGASSSSTAGAPVKRETGHVPSKPGLPAPEKLHRREVSPSPSPPKAMEVQRAIKGRGAMRYAAEAKSTMRSSVLKKGDDWVDEDEAKFAGMRKSESPQRRWWSRPQRGSRSRSRRRSRSRDRKRSRDRRRSKSRSRKRSHDRSRRHRSSSSSSKRKRKEASKPAESDREFAAFPPFSRVVLKDLQKNSELNGQLGQIVPQELSTWAHVPGCLKVRLDSGSEVAVKPTNLVLISLPPGSEGSAQPPAPPEPKVSTDEIDPSQL